MRREHALEAIAAATAEDASEGAVGAGTGTTCFGFKAGVGGSSRRTAEHVLGCLVVSNSIALRELFEAAGEAVHEAVLNSLCSAAAMEGRDGNRVGAFPYELLASAPGVVPTA